MTASVERPEYDPTVDQHPDYPLHVVGESYYQDALRDIVANSADPGPNWPYAGAQCEVMARLVPENDNPYDDQAVRVELNERKVGHLSRADARKYRRVFEYHAVPIKALIIGGWEHKGETHERAGGSFGVRLALNIVEDDNGLLEPPRSEPQTIPPSSVPPPVPAPFFRIEIVGMPGTASPEVRSAFEAAIEDGAIIRIVYHGGSRPGSIRDVRPLLLTSDMLRATDVAEGIDKTFRLDGIEIAPAGATVTPQITPVVGVPPSSLTESGQPFTVEVMRRPHQQQALAKMVGADLPPDGIATPARCVLRDGEVQVEISGAVIGALYSKYWWRYRMTMSGASADCRALITGPEFNVVLDLVFPPLDPELAFHEGAGYDCNIVGESKYQDTLKTILAERSATKRPELIPLVVAALIQEVSEGGLRVRVEIDGSTVGELSPGNVRRYRAMLELKPDTPNRTPAIIGRGGGMPWDSRSGLYDVRLDLWLPAEMPHPVKGYRRPPRKR